MKKVSFLIIILTANIFIVPGIRSAADLIEVQPGSAAGLISPEPQQQIPTTIFEEQKEYFVPRQTVQPTLPGPFGEEKPAPKRKKISLTKPLFGIIEKVKLITPMLKGAKEIGELFLNLFGLDEINQKVEILINSSIKLAKELKRKGGARIERLDELFIAMQEATVPLMSNLQEVITGITKQLKWITPILKLGRKTIKITTTKIDFSDENFPEGKKIKVVKEIPVKQIIKELPGLIVDNFFRPIKLYTSIIGNLIETIKQTQKTVTEKIKEKVKEFPEKTKQTIEKTKKTIKEGLKKEIGKVKEQIKKETLKPFIQ